MKKYFGFPSIAIALGLGLLFKARLFLDSLQKHLWLDETNSLFHLARDSYFHILENGLTAQCSLSPLYYLMDKAWLDLWGGQPQYWWNLDLFFRVPSIFYWIVVSLAVFFYAQICFDRIFKNQPRWQNLLFSTGLSMFFFSNELAMYYSLEHRPYSLWMSLSVLQFILVMEALYRPLGKKGWILLAILNFLIAAVANVAILQGAISAAILLLHEFWRKDGWRGIPAQITRQWRHIAWVFLIHTPALFSAFWYAFVVVRDCSGEHYGWFWYRWSVKEAVHWTFHVRSRIPKYVMVFLFGLGIPLVYRASPKTRWVYAFAIANLALTFIMFKICQSKDYVVHRRQYLFTIPSLSWMYFAGIGLVGIGISKAVEWVSKRRFLSSLPLKCSARSVLLGLILTAMGFHVIDLGAKHLSFIREKAPFWTERNAFSKVEKNERCPPNLPYFPMEVVELNENCRGFKVPEIESQRIRVKRKKEE